MKIFTQKNFPKPWDRQKFIFLIEKIFFPGRQGLIQNFFNVTSMEFFLQAR